MDNEKMEKIGKFISELRKSKGLTQKDLAEQMGVTDKAVSKWERGQSYPDISLIIPLSELFGVTANELLNGGENIASEIHISRDEQKIKSENEPNAESESGECVGIEEDKRKDSPHKAVELTSPSDNIMHELKEEKINWDKIRHIIFISFLGAILIAITVCMICDLAINDRLTWSPIVIISCVAGCILALPAIKAKRRVIMKTLIMLTIITVPYLCLLFYITSIWNIYAMGTPIYFVSIIGLWCIYIVFSMLKNKKLYAGGISFIIAIPVIFLINNIVEYFYTPRIRTNLINDFANVIVNVNVMDDIVNIIFMLILSAACFCTGYFLYNREKTE